MPPRNNHKVPGEGPTFELIAGPKIVATKQHMIQAREIEDGQSVSNFCSLKWGGVRMRTHFWSRNA